MASRVKIILEFDCCQNKEIVEDPTLWEEILFDGGVIDRFVDAPKVTIEWGDEVPDVIECFEMLATPEKELKKLAKRDRGGPPGNDRIVRKRKK